MAKVSFEYDAQELRTNIRNLDRRMESAVDALMDYEAAYATGQLKMRAPWTDRTGAARSGLLAVANKLGPGAHELIMSYSVHYGIWLEIANSGQYAVIGPFLPVMGRQLMHDLEHLIDRLERAR
ncbi:hypothetical protein HWB99_gp028 [Mycobacterium phage DrLupo]|uniref:Uncharacterized protein n=1 Tax=Mycobacterium phage DrLupo TaxID=2499037 RepID=A0A3S9UQK6_9CAUD|nr:hypothetical protein HWB99_gp028 [Mycobacterium phage DrLupo]AZS12564.1 hypothetical protein SEA_DRLUPO_28 [Mycobacterium phage DrLupo]